MEGFFLGRLSREMSQGRMTSRFVKLPCDIANELTNLLSEKRQNMVH